MPRKNYLALIAVLTIGLSATAGWSFYKLAVTGENLIQLARQSWRRVGLLRIPGGLPARVLEKLVNTDAELVEDGSDNAFVLLEEGEEEMKIVNDRISAAPGVLDGGVDGLGGFDGEAVWIDHRTGKV